MSCFQVTILFLCWSIIFGVFSYAFIHDSVFNLGLNFKLTFCLIFFLFAFLFSTITTTFYFLSLYRIHLFLFASIISALLCVSLSFHLACLHFAYLQISFLFCKIVFRSRLFCFFLVSFSTLSCTCSFLVSSRFAILYRAFYCIWFALRFCPISVFHLFFFFSIVLLCARIPASNFLTALQDHLPPIIIFLEYFAHVFTGVFFL